MFKSKFVALKIHMDMLIFLNNNSSYKLADFNIGNSVTLCASLSNELAKNRYESKNLRHPIFNDI